MLPFSNSATEPPSRTRAGMLARCAFCACRHAHGAAVRAWRKAAVLGRGFARPARLTGFRYALVQRIAQPYAASACFQQVRGPVPGVTDFSYSYDANKRKTREGHFFNLTDDQLFQYDDADRLTQWSRGGTTQVQTWTLTKVGDWTATTRTGADPTAEVRTHDAVHQLTKIKNGPSTAILTYDAKGNVTSDEQYQSFTWDPENRLRYAKVRDANEGISDVANYAYDALGRRVQKTIWNRTTTFINDGAQVVQEFDTPEVLSANAATYDGDLAGAGAPTVSPVGGSILPNASTLARVNFQPVLRRVPEGFIADKGKLYGVRSNGQTYGWQTAAKTAGLTSRNEHPFPQFDSFNAFTAASNPTATWEYALPNGTYPIILVLGDAASRNHTNHVVIEGQAFTDPDPAVAGSSYTRGDFDGYAVTVTIAGGKLTITAGAGAFDPTLCFIEIGKQGTALPADAATKLATAITNATNRTGGEPFAKPVASPRSYVYGSYIDEPLALITGSGAMAKTYFYHANHLYSVAALTDATGAVTERYSYSAYGAQTIKNAGGTTLAKSAVGNDRSFTGYIKDDENGLCYARARMYAPTLGRFISRDPIKYQDGFSLYSGYFVPRGLDPSGKFEFTVETSGSYLLAAGPVVPPVWFKIVADFTAKKYTCPCTATKGEEAWGEVSVGITGEVTVGGDFSGLVPAKNSKGSQYRNEKNGRYAKGPKPAEGQGGGKGEGGNESNEKMECTKGCTGTLSVFLSGAAGVAIYGVECTLEANIYPAPGAWQGGCLAGVGISGASISLGVRGGVVCRGPLGSVFNIDGPQSGGSPLPPIPDGMPSGISSGNGTPTVNIPYALM